MFSEEKSKPDIITSELKSFILSKASALCESNGSELVYLTLSGSTLHGTRVAGKSDVDVRGLFLPSIESLTLEAAPKSLQLASKKEEHGNSPEDVDIDLWSLQYWLLKLLPAGDTGALDLLFSPSHEACTLYCNPVLNAIFAAPLRLIDTEGGKGYAEYSIGQARKYGIKGSHLGALRAVSRFLSERSPDPDECLSCYFQPLAEACADERFCSIQEVKAHKMLYLCGKFHEGTLHMKEFARRVGAHMERFGERPREAERNNGLDLKALSHALRALIQMEELLTTGKVCFPLQRCEELISVKEGYVARDEVENRILKHLDTVSALRENAPFRGVPDAGFARSCLLSFYKPPGDSFPTSPSSDNNTKFAEGFQIPANTLEAIQDKLNEAEVKHDIRILYACESGSRGWNFSSKDSDYDVRFIYVHDRDRYLSAAPEEKPDTLDLGMECTPVGELDINGWELRKTLKLFRRSNGPLLEWLSSPLIYRERGSTCSRLRELAPDYFSPIALWHHYRGLMEKSRYRYQTESPTIKTLFYMLRPLFCMRWIELGHGIPPMCFDRVLETVIPDITVKAEMQSLVERKRRGGESDRFAPPLSVAAYVDEIIQSIKEPLAQISNREGNVLDIIFREAVG